MTRTFAPALAATLLFVCDAALAQSAEIGVDALVQRLGATTPNGSGVVVGQVEILESPGNYGPNQTSAEFTGKAFIAQSGSPGNSGHATLVAQLMFGKTAGMAPGISTIYLYEAASWAQTAFLRMNQGSLNPPLAPPGGLKIFNHSWVGSFNVALNTDALRRADFAVWNPTTNQAPANQPLMIVGVNNAGGGQAPLMCHMFNGISVGLSNGAHVSGPTSITYDGPNRMKPEVVAPSQFTSFACPLVDAVAARLVQTARTAPLNTNPNAERADVLKAVIMAGCDHRAAWTNCTGGCVSGATRGTTSAPLDAVYGSDVVNINNSHLILTGLEQAGANTPPTSVNIKRRGWDFTNIGANASKYYRFHISAVAPQASILIAWNRNVNSDLVTWSLANFTLTLHRVDTSGNLTTLVGNPGLPFFSSGNVVSQSSVDNVEHVFVRDLQPGDYTVQVQRIDALGGTRDVAIAWLLPKKLGDINEDGSVNVNDLLAVINSWGSCPPPCLPACLADVDGNCAVNVNDLLAVINTWG